MDAIPIAFDWFDWPEGAGACVTSRSTRKWVLRFLVTIAEMLPVFKIYKMHPDRKPGELGAQRGKYA